MTLFQRDMENVELGRKEGQEKMAALTKILLSENRIEDLKRTLEDQNYYNKLLKEYRI